MRYAIWTAVSTAEQARLDKASLNEQENKCRTFGDAKGWMETSGPYVVPGASRSFYVNLSDAEKDIPQLRQMLEDARNDKFDVLIIYTYDRLGDLVDMIAQSLRFYGKQIYSISQPVEPQDPQNYDPYAAESEAIMRDAARITQRFRIADLRRKYQAGMPVRVKKGLNPYSTPFGYKWAGTKEPPVVVPEQAAIILQMKDKFLRGASIKSLVEFAKASGVLTPRKTNNWDATTVRYILGNPFYAGFVAINKSKIVRDPRRKNQKKQVKQPRSKWQMEQGLHKPLWDEETYHALVDELERRREANQKVSYRFPYSGLLVCAVCNQKIHRQQSGTVNYGRKTVLSCKEGVAHVVLEIDHTVDRLYEQFTEHVSKLRLEKQNGKSDKTIYQRALDDLTTKRKRIQEGYLAGIYEQAEAARQVTDIEGQMDEIRFKMEEGEQLARTRKDFLNQLPPLDMFIDWMKEQEPQYAHYLLAVFIDKVVVYPDKRFEVVWRM